MDPDLETALALHSGVASRAALVRGGASTHALDSAVAAGSLVRVRRGVFAHHRVDSQIVRAVRVGGSLAGHSAARLLGLWQLPPSVADSLVVSVPPTCSGLRHPDDPHRLLRPRADGVTVLYDGHRLDRTLERLCVGVTTCVAQIIRSHRPEFGLAVLDSALRLPEGRRPLRDDLRHLLPVRCHAVVDAADGRAESGTESVMRWRLNREGVRFSIQQWPTESIRVDFLIMGFLVVECTSFDYHASPQQYRNDRERIATLVREGYVVLEFTYHQVLFQWEAVWEAIEVVLARSN